MQWLDNLYDRNQLTRAILIIASWLLLGSSFFGIFEVLTLTGIPSTMAICIWLVIFWIGGAWFVFPNSGYSGLFHIFIGGAICIAWLFMLIIGRMLDCSRLLSWMGDF